MEENIVGLQAVIQGLIRRVREANDPGEALAWANVLKTATAVCLDMANLCRLLPFAINEGDTVGRQT